MIVTAGGKQYWSSDLLFSFSFDASERVQPHPHGYFLSHTSASQALCRTWSRSLAATKSASRSCLRQPRKFSFRHPSGL